MDDGMSNKYHTVIMLLRQYMSEVDASNVAEELFKIFEEEDYKIVREAGRRAVRKHGEALERLSE